MSSHTRLYPPCPFPPIHTKAVIALPLLSIDTAICAAFDSESKTIGRIKCNTISNTNTKEVSLHHYCRESVDLPLLFDVLDVLNAQFWGFATRDNPSRNRSIAASFNMSQFHFQQEENYGQRVEMNRQITFFLPVCFVSTYNVWKYLKKYGKYCT